MLMFARLYQDQCCLCGATSDLTGEHKIKASALKSIFKNDAMLIGHFDGSSKPRLAQSPKSRVMHFGARVCSSCNGARTQPGDRAFDRFHKIITETRSFQLAFDDRFPSAQFPEGSTPYLDVFRYFGKLLCCQIADAGGPRLPAVAEFATRSSDFNPVKLQIKPDPTFREYSKMSGDFAGFAGHGGLVSKHTPGGELTGFHSTLTLNEVQYVYWVEFIGSVEAELSAVAPEFFVRTKAAYEDVTLTPMSPWERHQLGLL